MHPSLTSGRSAISGIQTVDVLVGPSGSPNQFGAAVSLTGFSGTPPSTAPAPTSVFTGFPGVLLY